MADVEEEVKALSLEEEKEEGGAAGETSEDEEGEESDGGEGAGGDDSDDEDEDDEEEGAPFPKVVAYCPNCGLPPGFCPWGENPEACANGEVPEGIAKPASSKKKKKAVSFEDEEEAPTGIVITKQSRTKNKSLTIVAGFSAAGIESKKAKKLFANKFASGCTLKDKDTVEIQGDVSYDVADFLEEEFGVNPDDITMVDDSDKKKKGPPGGGRGGRGGGRGGRGGSGGRGGKSRGGSGGKKGGKRRR